MTVSVGARRVAAHQRHLEAQLVEPVGPADVAQPEVVDQRAERGLDGGLQPGHHRRPGRRCRRAGGPAPSRPAPPARRRGRRPRSRCARARCGRTCRPRPRPGSPPSGDGTDRSRASSAVRSPPLAAEGDERHHGRRLVGDQRLLRLAGHRASWTPGGDAAVGRAPPAGSRVPARSGRRASSADGRGAPAHTAPSPPSDRSTLMHPGAACAERLEAGHDLVVLQARLCP